MLLPRLLKILKLIDPKKLKGLNDILERVYPGIKDEIERLVEHRDIHAMSKTLDYIKAHGGYEKIAEYYNNADQKGQDEMLSAFNEAFKSGARFEDAVLTLDGLAKVKDMGLYTQLLGDVKDSIVMTSIKLGYRTIGDWRTFVRRQREANKVVLLGTLTKFKRMQKRRKRITRTQKRKTLTNQMKKLAMVLSILSQRILYQNSMNTTLSFSRVSPLNMNLHASSNVNHTKRNWWNVRVKRYWLTIFCGDCVICCQKIVGRSG